MSRSLRFFTTSSSVFDAHKLLGRRRSAVSSSALPSRKATRSPCKEPENDSRQKEHAVGSTTSSDFTGESSTTSLDDISVTVALCPTAQEHQSLSQRLIVRMDQNAWNVSTRKGEPLASLQSPPHRDEMILHDNNGQECGVIIPTRSSVARGKFEYNVYTFQPTSPHQTPAMESNVLGVPSFYLYARFRAEQDAHDSFRFYCSTQRGKCFQADKIVWSTFQSWAFCIKEIMTSTPVTAARVTCLSDSERELLIYSRVDPLLMVAFVAVMEEVVLVSSL